MTETPWRGLEALVVSPTPTHPLDHGNRKRIFEICRALQRRGAKVHFVHYPGEHDWRSDRPARNEAAMMAQWDSYQLVAPTRSLHTPAAGADHAVDEWADRSVTDYLAWACQKRRYDIAIVNYTWMSFALEAIPPSVYKVLDTHDVCGGRRQLLESLGIGPEYFHTTVQEEARGVARADLVWAIKDSERRYFERDLGVADCLTMLHAEPPRDWWRAPPSTDGWLRAGVIGARNNVNRRNIEAFLDAALPIFESYMAPVKLIIAGGCSDDLEHCRKHNVEIVGRVSEVEDFYRSVDVVIAPLAMSTGLKIKVSEALASGAPVVAHAHAMDGYPTSERRHRLPDFESMALELARLSFERAPLSTLADQSRATCASIQTSVDVALEATRRRVVKKIGQKICVIAPMQALDQKSMLYDHFHAALDYIRQTNAIEIYFTGAVAKARPELLHSYGLQHHVFIDPVLWNSLGTRAPESWTPLKLSDVLEVRGYSRAYIMSDCREDFLFGVGALKQVFLRHDVIELAGGDPDALTERLRKTMRVVMIGAVPRRIQHWKEKSGIDAIVSASFRRSGDFRRLAVVPDDCLDALLLAPACDVVADEMAKLCERLGARVRRLDYEDPLIVSALVHAEEGEDPLAGLTQAKLVVDLSILPNSLSAALGEAVLRQGTPYVTLARGPDVLGLWRFPDQLRPASVGQLLRRVADALVDDETLASLRDAATREMRARTANDAGWSQLRRLLTSPPSSGAAQSEVEVVSSLFS